jgi:uncharacterized protein (DUF305 family)
MCEEASIEDAEIAELCEEIVQAQQEEIDQMKAILETNPLYTSTICLAIFSQA